MGRNQTLVLWGVIAIAVLMALYPPYLSGKPGYEVNKGYVFIAHPPDAAKIDITRLVIQEIALVIVGAGLFITLRSRPAKPGVPDSREDDTTRTRTVESVPASTGTTAPPCPAVAPIEPQASDTRPTDQIQPAKPTPLGPPAKKPFRITLTSWGMMVFCGCVVALNYIGGSHFIPQTPEDLARPVVAFFMSLLLFVAIGGVLGLLAFHIGGRSQIAGTAAYCVGTAFAMVAMIPGCHPTPGQMRSSTSAGYGNSTAANTSSKPMLQAESASGPQKAHTTSSSPSYSPISPSTRPSLNREDLLRAASEPLPTSGLVASVELAGKRQAAVDEQSPPGLSPGSLPPPPGAGLVRPNLSDTELTRRIIGKWMAQLRPLEEKGHWMRLELTYRPDSTFFERFTTLGTDGRESSSSSKCEFEGTWRIEQGHLIQNVTQTTLKDDSEYPRGEWRYIIERIDNDQMAQYRSAAPAKYTFGGTAAAFHYRKDDLRPTTLLYSSPSDHWPREFNDTTSRQPTTKFSPRAPRIDVDRANAMSQAYVYCGAQEIKMTRISQQFPMYREAVESLKMLFDARFRPAVNNLDRILGATSLRNRLLTGINDAAADAISTTAEAEAFMSEVLNRAAGRIPSPILETLLLFDPEYINNPSRQFTDGFRRQYRSDGTGKAYGLQLGIQHPATWTSTETSIPYVLAAIENQSGHGDAVSIGVVPDPSPTGGVLSQATLLAAKDQDSTWTSISPGAKIVDRGVITLGSRPATWAQISYQSKISDTAAEDVFAWSIMFLSGRNLVNIAFIVKEPLSPTGPTAADRFRHNAQLFRLMLASVEVFNRRD